MSRAYSRNPTALDSFDPATTMGYQNVPPLPPISGLMHGFRTYFNLSPPSNESPFDSWNGVVRHLNRLLGAPYTYEHTNGGVTVSSDSPFGSIMHPSAALPEVSANHRWSRQDILRARDFLRQFNPMIVFDPLPRRWSRTVIQELIVARWTVHAGADVASVNAFGNTGVTMTLDMGLGAGPQGFIRGSGDLQAGTPYMTAPDYLKQWALEDRYADQPADTAEPRGTVLVDDDERPPLTNGSWSVWTGVGGIKVVTGTVIFGTADP